MKNIAVLGDGITAKAVREFLDNSNDFSETTIDHADLIVTSPGIPPRQWPETQLEIISDIEFAYRILKSKKIDPTIIGITGTNGKTTVASGVAHLIDDVAYGNIGRPLISDINQITASKIIVLELSSFQLATSPTLHCNIAVIVNIEPDHIDWHYSFDAYSQAKKSIIKSNQHLYLPQTISKTTPIPDSTTLKLIEKLKVKSLPQFNGVHNQSNLSIIYDIGFQLNLSEQTITEKLETFKLPPYRCQIIYSKDGLTIINDSKATNMAATMAAIHSCTGKKILILSGQVKEPFSHAFMKTIVDHCEIIYASGDLAKDKTVFPVEWRSKITWFESLKLATLSALKICQSGTILFSPAAASFDEFNNYIERGEAFSSYVKQNI